LELTKINIEDLKRQWIDFIGQLLTTISNLSLLKKSGLSALLFVFVMAVVFYGEGEGGFDLVFLSKMLMYSLAVLIPGLLLALDFEVKKIRPFHIVLGDLMLLLGVVSSLWAFTLSMTYLSNPILLAFTFTNAFILLVIGSTISALAPSLFGESQRTYTGRLPLWNIPIAIGLIHVWNWLLFNFFLVPFLPNSDNFYVESSYLAHNPFAHTSVILGSIAFTSGYKLWNPETKLSKKELPYILTITFLFLVTYRFALYTGASISIGEEDYYDQIGKKMFDVISFFYIGVLFALGAILASYNHSVSKETISFKRLGFVILEAWIFVIIAVYAGPSIWEIVRPFWK